MRTMRTLGTLIATAGLVGVAVIGMAAPAQAASRDGVCQSGEFCYYYNSGNGGSVSDFTGSVSDYGTTQPSCYDFRGSGAGKGQCVKNRAASVWNRSSQLVRVYYNTGYTGAYQDIAAGQKGNLNATLKNNDASHRFRGASYPSGDDYPYKGQSTGVDPWGFYKGECTSFAAWTVRSRLHLAFTNSYKGQHWGNAHNWDNAARSAGISVSGTPKAGDVAVRNSGTFGHVAIVTTVNGSTFEIDEYNHNQPHAWSHRTTSVGSTSSHFDSFIHFK